MQDDLCFWYKCNIFFCSSRSRGLHTHHPMLLLVPKDLTAHNYRNLTYLGNQNLDSVLNV